MMRGEGAFLFSREFRCWCNATTAITQSCYRTPCQPLNAWTDDLYPITYYLYYYYYYYYCYHYY